MGDLKLYKVGDGAVVYWVAAALPDDAVSLVLKCEGVEEGDDEFGWLDEPPDVTEIDDATASTAVCRGDGEPDMSMLQAFRQMKEPGVIACSEWP